jgi:hypothetical protein
LLNHTVNEFLSKIENSRNIVAIYSSRRRDELFTNATSSDDERRQAGGVRRPRNDAPVTPGFNVKKRLMTNTALSIQHQAVNNKKIIDRKAELNKSSAGGQSALTAGGRKAKFSKKNSSIQEKNSARVSSAAVGVTNIAETSSANVKELKVKKAYRKRKPSEKVTVAPPAATVPTEKRSAGSAAAKKAARRKSQTVANNTTDSDAESVDGGVKEPVDEADRNQQHLRSWIDQYEEAVTNHYSPELRARLSGNKFAGLGNELRSNVIGGPTRCNVSLKGNGVKVIEHLIFYNFTEPPM